MADIQVVYEKVLPPIREIHLTLTVTEAEVLAFTAARLAGPHNSVLEMRQPEANDYPQWNPQGLSLTEVRDVLREIGNAIIKAGGSKRKP